MDRPRNRQNKLRTPGSPEAAQTLRRRGQLHPFFFRLGPVTLSVCCVLLISSMAILYLSQLGQAVTINQQIQDLRNKQALLQRQNSDLSNTVANEQSPAYIATHARAEGLVPADPQNVQVIVVPNVKAQQNGDVSAQP
jgi:cell division protein FtsL